MIRRERRGVGEMRVGVSVQSMGEMGKDFCPNFLHSFLENMDRRGFNNGNGKLFHYFTTLT